jgi:hypothetical protein
LITVSNIFSIKKTQIYLTSILFIILVGYEFSITNKGLDLNDGGWSLLRASFPQSEIASLGRDGYYMQSLFILFKGSVSALRITSIIMLGTALFIFSFGIVKYFFLDFQKDKFFAIQLFLLLVISTIPCFWIERQPTYNVLGTFSFFCAIGTALLAASHRKNGHKPYFLLLLLSGLFIALGLLTRFPVVGPTFVVLFILYYSKFKFNGFFLSLLILSAGITLGFVLHFTLYETPQELINTYNNGWELAQISYPETIHEKLLRQSLEILSVWQVALGRHKLFIILSFLIVAAFPKSRKWCMISGIIWVTITSYSNGDLNGGFNLFSNYYRFWSSLGFILFPVIFLRLDFKEIPILKISKLISELTISTALLILFLLLPPFCALGAGSTLLYMGNFFGCLHPLVLILVAKKNGIFQPQSEMLTYLVLFLLCIGPTINHYNSRFNSPLFSVDGSMVNECTKSTQVGYFPTEIQMSERQSLLLNRLNNILKTSGFERGTKVLNFTDLPGLVYAVGGDFNIHAWTNVHHGSKVPYFMQNATIEDIKYSWILLDTMIWNDRIEVSFNFRNIDFSNTHYEIGRIDKFKIYKPIAFHN